MELNDEQQRVYDIVVFKKKNMFVTAAGGAGKSFLIKKIYKDSKPYYNVAITSLTGVSAQLIGGQTIHSYLGIGLGEGSYEKLLSKLQGSKFALNRWQRLDLLIVDEVSMMNIELFEKLEHLARTIRKCDKPFGGIQLLFSGDFMQLKPVLNDKFCFESPKWNLCFSEPFGETILLKKIVRQSDEVFASVLNKIRIGNIDDECKKIIESREIPYNSSKNNGLIPTMLYSTNAKVDATNERYYNKLVGDEYTYKISYTWKQNVYDKERFENMVKLPYELKLKIGAQVMHLVNTCDGKLVNGSRGVVTNFVEGYPLVLFVGGIERIIVPECLDIEDGDFTILTYAQVPLRLAFSVTIHKAQGSSLDLVRVDLKNIFEFGQFYVALSRVRSLEGLFIRNLDWNRCKIAILPKQFYRELEEKQKLSETT